VGSVCRTHGYDHALVGDRCGPAPAEPAVRVKAARRVVANSEPVVANVVANKPASRHGRYADLEKRRAYMRDLMRRRRASR